jgi:yecA family protein
MKTLPVDVGQLAAALEDHSRELGAYYFDSHSGEIVLLSEELRGSDKRWNIVSNSVGRFIAIESMDSREGFAIMEEFVATLPPSPLQEKLNWSLEGPKPFGRFRDTLNHNLEQRAQWLEFRNAAMRKIALEWLTDHDIDPVEQISQVYPSLLDQEAEALVDEEEEVADEEFDDIDGEDLDGDGTDDLDEFYDEDEEIDPLSEDEEAELTDFVESLPGVDFNLANLHGLLSAFAAGPVIMTPAEILAVLKRLARDQSANEHPDSEHILDLLSRFYNGIVETFEFDSFQPQLQQQGVMVTDPSAGIVSWCRGFALGVEFHKSSWQRWFEDIRRAKAISLIMGMADPEILRQTENAIGEEVAWATASSIGDLVPLIRDYWAFEFALDDFLGPQPDNPELKVGRNDPCPCGSGKKFKHCHGRLQSG